VLQSLFNIYESRGVIMGGNVFPEGVTRRFQSDEYFKLSDEVLCLLTRSDTQWSQNSPIPAYRKKESFGDLDILYSTTNDKPFDVGTFAKIYDTEYVSQNSGVISIAYKCIQVDFIHVPEKHFDYAYSYFSWNDCGNLVGKLARRFGLKHGHDGLFLSLHNGFEKFAQILLTVDHTETLEFLGLDKEKFHAGFDDLNQIFEFVAASPNYNPDWYLMENISSAGRMRDKKRDTYRKFLDFGAAYTGPRAPKFKSKSECLERIFAFFPDAHPKFLAIMDDVARAQVVKGKFNGKMVQELTGLKEKMLGKFMEYLRADFNFSPAMIVYLTDEQISANIVMKFGDWSKISEALTIQCLRHSMNNQF
jgi:hypothetical protein